MEERIMSVQPDTGYHVIVALVSGVLGVLITYIVGVVRLKDQIHKEVDEKYKEIFEHCDTCRAECKEVRDMKEKDLEGKLTQGDRQFTYIRLLLEDVICEKLEIDRARIERIQKISGVLVAPTNRGGV
jgi:hypothetical protein